MSMSSSSPATSTPGSGWRRASRCTANGCVEVQVGDGTIAVRDSKHEGAAPLIFDAEEWRVFVDGVKAGEFDVPAVGDAARTLTEAAR